MGMEGKVLLRLVVSIDKTVLDSMLYQIRRVFQVELL